MIGDEQFKLAIIQVQFPEERLKNAVTFAFFEFRLEGMTPQYVGKRASQPMRELSHDVIAWLRLSRTVRFWISNHGKSLGSTPR